MCDKSTWLQTWGYAEGTAEAEAAWQAKLAFKPSRSRISITNASYEYACPISENPISSKWQHEENLKRTNCRLFEPGEREGLEKSKAEEEANFDRKIEQSVEREIESYSSAQRETLHNELVHGGLDVSIDRL